MGGIPHYGGGKPYFLKRRAQVMPPLVRQKNERINAVNFGGNQATLYEYIGVPVFSGISGGGNGKN
jgi:hypothetical protein